MENQSFWGKHRYLRKRASSRCLGIQLIVMLFLQYTLESALNEYLAAVSNLREDLQKLIAAGRSLGVPDDHPRQRAGLELQHRLDENPDQQRFLPPAASVLAAAPAAPAVSQPPPAPAVDEAEGSEKVLSPSLALSSSDEEGPPVRPWKRWCQKCLRGMGKEGAEGRIDQPGPRAKACISCASAGHACLAFPDEVREGVQRELQPWIEWKMALFSFGDWVGFWPQTPLYCFGPEKHKPTPAKSTSLHRPSSTNHRASALTSPARTRHRRKNLLSSKVLWRVFGPLRRRHKSCRKRYLFSTSAKTT
jgi:hypothetical protein